MQGNYERILEKISRVSGLGKDELERKVDEKRTKLSGLISKEGAAQVVASELGISFDNEKLKINELLPGMRKVNTLGKVINIFPVRTFTTKKGDESKVVNFWIADETSNIKVVLWDTNHIELIETGKISQGTVVEIMNGSMRDSEIHLGSFSELKISSQVIDDIKTEKVFREKTISEFKRGENTGVRAFILQFFEPRFFNICPECNKKVIQEGEGFSCEKHGKVMPSKRAVTNLVIDDGTGSIRTVLFHDAILKMGFSQIEDLEKFSEQKENFIGKEMIFTGNVRNNNFFNTIEFIAEDVREVEPDSVIANLEKQG
jgi:replication factor A1